MMSNRRERREERRGMTWLLGRGGPAGRVDATNYLVDSVNWSHSDWANLSTVPFVSDTCCYTSVSEACMVSGKKNDHSGEDGSHYTSAFLSIEMQTPYA